MDWLFKEDNYIPANDKNNHIDKSVLSIMGVLSKIRQEDKSGRRGLYTISSVIKFIFTILFIFFLVLSRSFYYVLLVDSYALLLISMLVLKDIKKIFYITTVVFMFSTILLFPSVFMGNLFNSLLMLFKIIGCVMMLNILSYSTKWRNINSSLKLFLIPDVFILIVDMAIKYIVILGDYSINMLYALKMRSVGKDKNKHTSLSNLIGVLFLKTKEMAEETFYAMESRCFTGDYKSKVSIRIHLGDFIYIFTNIIIIVLFFVIKKG